MTKVKFFDLFHNENEVDMENRINKWIEQMQVNVVDIKFSVNLESDHKIMDVMVIYKH